MLANIKRKVRKDLIKRINYSEKELERRERLSIRRTTGQIAGPAW
jgi:hypothetical protein